MSVKHELLSMAERCRICLVDRGCMTSLQNERLEDKLKDLTKCTCIDIKYEENLPGVVCHICLYKLNMWSEFKDQFIQSNRVLLEQLDISEASDNTDTIEDSPKDKGTTNNAERKRKINGDNSLEKKKSRMDMSSSEVTCDMNQIILDTISISSNDDTLSKNDVKNDKEHTEDKMYSGPTRTRLLPARRGRNIERRKASTKRWVERKKALLAAIGENVSDTDSIASDDVQLSPVQKARAKTNADKELERQKKIAKVLKNLETNLTEKYSALLDRDTDSDARRTRLSTSQQSSKNLLNQSNKKNSADRNRFSSSSLKRENSLASLTNNNTTLDDSRNSEMQDDQAFTPNSLKSELVIGDITFAVTSTLILVDPSKCDKEDLNNLTKDSNCPDESNRERNTDIIDAVQLRRVNPVAKNKPKNKFVERCLNIEVEGNELSVLKRIQYDLANFVQKEMKHKFLNTGITKTNKMDNTSTFQQKLDQKLKDIIEVAIKKNIDFSVGNMDNARNQGSTRFPPMLVKSFRYQPKVMIKRLDIEKESKRYNINNVHALKPSLPRSKFNGPFNMIGKRQSILPVRFGDYATIVSESDVSDNDDDDINDWSPPPKAINSKTSKNIATKQSTTIVKPMGNRQEQKADSEKAIKVESAIAGNHICGVCGITFNTRKEVEAHVRNHKLTSDASLVQVVLQDENATTPQKMRQGKQKMMRCKRCHEIVEARFVKTHVCKTSLHKCYVCNSMFRTKNLLTKHLESHEHTAEFNIANTIGTKKLNSADALLKILSVASASPPKDQPQKTETTTKTETTVNEKNDIQSDKITSTGVKLDGTENASKPKETYTCFVCDKIFTDEEILKDHLQKHCDDLSEGEQVNSKDQYQCAICGNTLESDQALEEHVGKHLFDDEDDNPNLISIEQDSDKSKDNNTLRETNTYQCGQCSEIFDSEILLEMHMQAHEEEVAIEEWQKQEMRVYQYQCMLCDELFDTEKELTEHWDIHNANAQVCQLCDKPFRTLEDLQEHVATH